MSPALHGALWMSGAIVSFTSMAVAGRALHGAHDTFEIMLFRSVLGFFVVVGIAWSMGNLHQISRRNLRLHLIRNACHFVGQNLWFFAVPLIPLAQVFALEFTTPIWAMLFATVVLAERLTTRRVITAVVGFCGVLIVAQPGLAVQISPGLAAAALAAVGFAGAAVFTRLLTRTETITCILFYLTVIQAAFGLIMAGYDGQITAPTAATLPWLILVGLAGLLAHFCLTKALSIAPAAVVMPVDFARLPIVAVVGMALYNEQLNWTVLFGATLIFFANYTNLRAEARSPTSR